MQTDRADQELPNITAALESLKGAGLFSAFDLRSGFFQVELDEPSRHKTAFSTRYGKWEYLRMPMGLITSPKTFDVLMACVLRGLTWDICQVYLDDVIVFSPPDYDEHLSRISQVLQRFQDAALVWTYRRSRQPRVRRPPPPWPPACEECSCSRGR